MIPNDPIDEAPPLSSEPLPAEVPPHKIPFWDYQDLLVFFLLALPCLLVAGLFVRAASALIRPSVPVQQLLVQLLWYILVFSMLYALLRLRYGQPFWRSLGWGPPFRGANRAFIAGPFVAFGIGYLGILIHTPEIQTPFRQMLLDRTTIVLFAMFAVVIGPLCEELAFRGFLMPLLVRSLGALPGVILTGVLFGSLHAPEYSWSWKHALLISAAGSIFGWVRYRTGSTAAATFMHSSYNLTQFVFFVAQGRAHD